MTGKIAIVTDSNSGITQEEGKKLGIHVLPMPFMIDEKPYLDGIDLTHEMFYQMLEEGAEVVTSQPSPESVKHLWDQLLQEYEEVLHIPMSSGLSGSCESAMMLAKDYQGKVQVVDNQRISVTLRQSAIDAKMLAQQGKSAVQIKEILEREKFNSSIYIMLDTLHYLKKGGRVTPAAAAVGTILRIKPVLQIQGEKLDAFAKARTAAHGKSLMINAIHSDMEKRFGGALPEQVWLEMAYTGDLDAANRFKEEVQEAFPGFEIVMIPLSLSVACHIGPGALAVACSKKIQ